MALHRWLYQGGKPGWLAKRMNSFWSWLHASGLVPNYLVALEITGRRTGKTIRFPLVMAIFDGERYLVSMLGENANWVQNIRAAEGKATLVNGKREAIRLVDVMPNQRALILKEYLRRAPGARPHIRVDHDAPLVQFEEIAADFPVFHVVREQG